MNNSDDLMYRLLHLYPVRRVKEIFPVEVRRQDELIYEIISNQTTESIYQFAADNFNFTKQHVHIYAHNEFDLSNAEAIFSVLPYKTDHMKEDKVFYLFMDQTYKVMLTNPPQESTIVFKLPMKVTFNKRLLIIQFTILERDINSYFPNRIAFILSKNIDEESIIRDLESNFNQVGVYLTEQDMHKGIKKLWQEDYIDSPYVKYRKSKSISSEAMDETFYVKRDYPDVYEQIIKAPLSKTVFEIFKDKDLFGEKFTIDPTSGKMNFPRYATNINHYQNVIELIIKYN